VTDRRIPLVVTYGLVLAVILGLIGINACAILEKDIPVELVTITSAALAGLTALLASTRSEPGPT
jgi:hypothetical protein